MSFVLNKRIYNTFLFQKKYAVLFHSAEKTQHIILAKYQSDIKDLLLSNLKDTFDLS